MFSMERSVLELANLVKHDCDLIVTGGPLPTLFPDTHLETFDAVCVGEGEQTMLELTEGRMNGGRMSDVKVSALMQMAVQIL